MLHPLYGLNVSAVIALEDDGHAGVLKVPQEREGEGNWVKNWRITGVGELLVARLGQAAT